MQAHYWWEQFPSGMLKMYPLIQQTFTKHYYVPDWIAGESETAQS